MKSKRPLLILVSLISLVFLVTLLGLNHFNADFDVKFYRKVARETRTDGWVFTFVRDGYKDPLMDDSTLIKYQFYGINQRYQYDEEYIRMQVQTTPEGYSQVVSVIPACLKWGTGSDAEKRDMQLIQSILSDPQATDESLLAIDPDDYTFEVLDKELFFRLMKTALTSDPQKEGADLSYWDKPSYAFLTESLYIDGYKFQVCFMQETGCVDELYIDVLYQTGNGYKDYIQLSDLVDSGDATEGQVQAFELIQSIVIDIKNEESFVVNYDTYKDVEIEDIDFSRLYIFLKNIHTNNYEQYIGESIVEIYEGDDSE